MKSRSPQRRQANHGHAIAGPARRFEGPRQLKVRVFGIPATVRQAAALSLTVQFTGRRPEPSRDEKNRKEAQAH
ncbi:hypothetical protein K788_0000878 [Paraburkholderia caribensis MBA4]|uniref:Uncharacterized protein n=1 Tax=Paraburkholderia caribensis MBA4 TaxID=1323664 RepID=A0A0P0RI47_9BURK|nr:hypothetical protein K788_0000878 [Paraburkholderia caribensis MBA4]